MKLLLITAILMTSFTAQAAEKFTNCKDETFNGLPVGINHTELKYRNRFTEVLKVERMLAPGGFENIFGEGENICRKVHAAYLRHNPSNKLYAMITTYDDSCDGGNTLGAIIDMDEYEASRPSLVAEIGDSEVVCIKKTEQE